MASFQRMPFGKVEEINFIVEKSDNYKLSKVIKVNINNDKSCYLYVPLIRLDDNGTLFSSQTHNLSLIMRIILDKYQFRDIL